MKKQFLFYNDEPEVDNEEVVDDDEPNESNESTAPHPEKPVKG